MSIYVISDLHLSLSEKVHKPMDVFGYAWVNHTERLKTNWEATVSKNDTVIIAGDISWALKLDEAVADLNWISGLPGKKVIVKGNHDLWWASIKKLNDLYGDELCFIQNDFYEAEGYAVCGSRGWVCPDDEYYSQHDEKIYNRELMRLRASLESAKKAGFSKIIGALHFPPMNDKFNKSGFTELFNEFGVEQVFYGHLHSEDGFRRGFQGNMDGVEYKLVTLDYLKCNLLKVNL